MKGSRDKARAAAPTKATPPKYRRDVGYCRPPKEHQFKPGRSGNPKGRPKGAKNETTILRNIFNRRIDIREGGRTRRISVLEGVLLKFADDALKGNTKAATFLLNRYRLAESPVDETHEIDQDDRAILEDFAKRLEEDLKSRKRK